MSPTQTPLPRLEPGPEITLDLKAVRKRLKGVQGQEYWRSLEELANTPEFEEMLHREFPPNATEWWDGLDRRNFLKMAAASLALAGLTACTKQPVREILPYIKQPTELVLGEPLYYATSMVLGGFATGVLAKSREGHPIKVDGNPEHPSTLGGSSVWLQTSILNLYDPDRSQTVTRAGDIGSWAGFLSDLNQIVQEQEQTQGEGLRLLTETITSPTLAAEIQQIQEKFPKAKWHQYDPVTRDLVREGSILAFGDFVETHYRFDRARVILSLEADFLYTHPERLRYSRQFIDGRRVSTGKREMSRCYVVESTPTVTGTVADHRLPVESAHIEDLARAVALALDITVQHPRRPLSGPQMHWAQVVAKDLRQHRGWAIVLAGESQPPVVHALAHLLNQELGNVGQTVSYRETAEAAPALSQTQSLRQLAEDMESGSVEALFILSGNPAYSAPADMEFARLLSRVKGTIHLGLYLDETAARCTWHIPQTHYLESWGDARAFDGTVSFLQPLIAPLYGGKSAYELLGLLLQQQPARTDYEIVREFWQQQHLWPDFEKGWREALHSGFVPGTLTRERKMKVRNFESPAATGRSSDEQTHSPAGEIQGVEVSSFPSNASENASPFPTRPRRLSTIQNVELCFRPDPNLWDGRFANNGWLQECPKPVSKLTWDNAVLISPALAERSGLTTNDLVEVSLAGRTIQGPILVTPGQAENTVTVSLGYGRTRAGRVGDGVGFNAYAIRPSDSPWVSPGASLRSTGRRHPLVATQTHHNLENPDRQIYRATNLDQLQREPEIVRKSVTVPDREETLYNPGDYKYEGYRWGMSIDLTSCIGCNACVVACEVENNIPVVGKQQVARHREMLWLRIDTYYQGSLDNPEFSHAPIPCMHCEHAPCELVCPVAAAVHDSEGLNLQVYQRCVGTRFCSNNCPYKVRRFNFLRYTDYHTPNWKPMYNPEVTVRWRGVMEKCTYCVQRIASARITAEKENRRIRDGEVRTACQQACPTEAIVFGDLNTAESSVARLKSQSLDFPMLGQLNTRPRTTYLAKVGNRNRELEANRSSAQSKDA
jgi:MoCo/4Fe-4S cofactor protein with predicted Tat translocation signal